MDIGLQYLADRFGEFKLGPRHEPGAEVVFSPVMHEALVGDRLYCPFQIPHIAGPRNQAGIGHQETEIPEAEVVSQEGPEVGQQAGRVFIQKLGSGRGCLAGQIRTGLQQDRYSGVPVFDHPGKVEAGRVVILAVTGDVGVQDNTQKIASVALR